MISNKIFLGVKLSAHVLRSKEDVLQRLAEEGCTYSTLTQMTEQYYEDFRADFVYHYPLCDGEYLGMYIVPVKEGFLRLPYNKVDEGSGEIFVLSGASLLSADELRFLANDLVEYAKAFSAALTEAAKLLE